MTAARVGESLVALCREGRFSEAVEEHYSPEIVSVEAAGEPRETRGIDAVWAKLASFDQQFETVGCTVNGPWTNEPFFIAQFVIEVVDRQSGERQTMDEYALYEVRQGKIVGERFF